MKISSRIAIVFLSVCSFHAVAADRNYSISDIDSQQTIDIYNDGRNTYVQAVPGLVIRGATADGDRLVVRDVPNVINAELAGKKISLTRRFGQVAETPQKTIVTAALINRARSAEAALAERLERLERDIAGNSKSSNRTDLINASIDASEKIVSVSDRIKDGTKSSIDSNESLQKWDVVASDVRLANTFERWAQKAGWRVQWDASKHFLIDGASTFTGTFEDAIKAALMTPGIQLGAYPLEACVYGNTPPMIRITRQGEQTKECPDY